MDRGVAKRGGTLGTAPEWHDGWGTDGGLGVGAVFPWLCSLMMGGGQW